MLRGSISGGILFLTFIYFGQVGLFFSSITRDIHSVTFGFMCRLAYCIPPIFLLPSKRWSRGIGCVRRMQLDNLSRGLFVINQAWGMGLVMPPPNPFFGGRGRGAGVF